MGQRPAPYSHYRPADGTVDSGVYRVVGRDDKTVTLLRVADGDGGRVHHGVVEAVEWTRFDEEFVSADNPDADGDSHLSRALVGVGIGFLAVAGLSRFGVLTAPAGVGTLATVGLLFFVAGRAVERFDLPDPF